MKLSMHKIATCLGRVREKGEWNEDKGEEKKKKRKIEMQRQTIITYEIIITKHLQRS